VIRYDVVLNESIGSSDWGNVRLALAVASVTCGIKVFVSMENNHG